MAQPPAAAAGGGGGGHHWLATAPPDLRAKVVRKIIKTLPRPNGPPDQHQLAHLHAVASRYEARVFGVATSMQDYITTISKKMTQIQNRDQTSAHAASNLQQPAQMGSQMQQANAAQANYSVRPLQMAPAARPSATHQTQHPPSHISSGLCNLQPQPQPQPRLMGIMNQQHLRRVNQMQRVQQANVAVMQNGHPGGQNKNNQQYESPPTSEIITRNNAEEVEWREDLFQKITSLKDAHFAELMEYDRALDVRDITNEQFESMPEKKADRCRKLQKIKGMIQTVLSFLQLQKGNIPEQAMGQLGKCQDIISGLRQFFRMERKKAPLSMDQPRIKSVDKAEALRGLARELGLNLGRSTRLRRTIDSVSCEEEETSEPESKRQKMQSFGYGYITDRVLDEVRDAHRELLETEVSIISDTTGAAAAADGPSMVVGFFYTAVTLPPDFRGAFEVSEVYAKLLVPADYPRSSPAVLPRGELREGFPCSVDAAFQDAFSKLPEHRSIVDIARAFDSCVRSVVAEFVKMIRMWELESYMESRRQYMQNYDPRMGSCICK